MRIIFCFCFCAQVLPYSMNGTYMALLSYVSYVPTPALTPRHLYSIPPTLFPFSNFTLSTALS